LQHWQIALDQVALFHRTFEGAEFVAKKPSSLLGFAFLHRTDPSGVVRLVFADLGAFGGIDRDSTQIVDLDFEHGTFFHRVIHLGVQPGESLDGHDLPTHI